MFFWRNGGLAIGWDEMPYDAAKQQDNQEDLVFYLACRQAKAENDFLSDEDAQAFLEKLPQYGQTD